MDPTPIEIYVACPYTSSDPDVRQRRFRAATRYTASLIRSGHIVFSPLTHGRPCERWGLPRTWGFWQRSCDAFLSISAELHILKLPGWNRSTGVSCERHFMEKANRQITYIDRSDCFYPSPQAPPP